jgi:hypothetical protein
MRSRPRMRRALPRRRSVSRSSVRQIPLDEPRQVFRTTIDFQALGLPQEVRYALADAFWNHVGAREPAAIRFQWYHLRCFGRFVAQTQGVQRLADLDRALLLRYIEWLGQQRTSSGTPWSKSSRAVAYTALRKLLQWLERCRPGLIKPISYPYNPFPGRRRDAKPRKRLSVQHLRAILRACEKDIENRRALRLGVAEERRIARTRKAPLSSSRGALLEYIDEHCRGIVPRHRSAKFWKVERALASNGGRREIAPYLYPTSDALMPYYIAILIHTAGNPEAIAALGTDCLRPLPLLDEREMLVWEKPRASTLQRRTFRRDAPHDPPALVRELIEWTTRLRQQVTGPLRSRLFLYHGPNGITCLAPTNLVYIRRRFVQRHQLADFELAGIRPSVLTAFYRASGDLSQVRAVANHANISTTVAYVESPEVEAENRIRVATLQNAFLGHVRDPGATRASGAFLDRAHGDLVATRDGPFPSGEAVSMFGFSCQDPFAGVAPGTHAGELCTNFLGCLTCPNAILTHDTRTLARLLQARDHLRAASSQLHPARWTAIYAPQLAILEHDILTRFSAEEMDEAQRLTSMLPSLPSLR